MVSVIQIITSTIFTFRLKSSVLYNLEHYNNHINYQGFTMHYEGMIIRPPSEAKSVLLQDNVIHNQSFLLLFLH